MCHLDRPEEEKEAEDYLKELRDRRIQEAGEVGMEYMPDVVNEENVDDVFQAEFRRREALMHAAAAAERARRLDLDMDD